MSEEFQSAEAAPVSDAPAPRWERQKAQHDQALQLQQYVERYAASKPYWAELEAEIQHHVAGLRGTNPHMASREVLDIAYRRAVAANPQYDTEKKAEAKRAADAAKKAASLNVKSGGSSVFMKAAKGDVYAGMYEIYDRMNGGGRT